MNHPFHHRSLAEILVARGYLRHDDLIGRDAAKAGFAEALLQDNLVTSLGVATKTRATFLRTS
jgi:hypothetical protein